MYHGMIVSPSFWFLFWECTGYDMVAFASGKFDISVDIQDLTICLACMHMLSTVYHDLFVHHYRSHRMNNLELPSLSDRKIGDWVRKEMAVSSIRSCPRHQKRELEALTERRTGFVQGCGAHVQRNYTHAQNA